MPHSRSEPPTDQEDTILYALQHHGGLTNYWLAGRAGYEDGMYPDEPQWGPPGPAADRRARRTYERAYKDGHRFYRLAQRVQDKLVLAAAKWWLTQHWPESTEGNSAAEPQIVCSDIDHLYPGGWKRFERDWLKRQLAG